jgi:hypothetical protein
MRYSARLRAEVRAAPEGAPDSVQGLSGAPPDCPVAHMSEAPMVRIQWPGDVAGAPDSVRCAMRQQPPPTALFVVGAINTPNHPPFIVSKFSAFKHLTRAIAFNTRHNQRDQILSKVKDHSNQIVTSERDTCVYLSSCAWIAFLFHSFLCSTQL